MMSVGRVSQQNFGAISPRLGTAKIGRLQGVSSPRFVRKQRAIDESGELLSAILFSSSPSLLFGSSLVYHSNNEFQISWEILRDSEGFWGILFCMDLSWVQSMLLSVAADCCSSVGARSSLILQSNRHSTVYWDALEESICMSELSRRFACVSDSA